MLFQAWSDVQGSYSIKHRVFPQEALLSQEMIKYSVSYRWLPFRGAIANWVYLIIKDNQSYVFLNQ